MKYHRALTAVLLSTTTLAMANTTLAQDADPDEVIAVGIRQSLENALIEKREADSLVEVILAEDIGKLPDQNLAEVLETLRVFRLPVRQVLVQVFKFAVRMKTVLKSTA